MSVGAVAYTGDAISINLGATSTTGQALVIVGGAAGRTTDLVTITDSGTSTGDSLLITTSGADTGAYSIAINRDGNSASTIYGMLVEVDNAGAGTSCGIDFASFAAGEPLFRRPTDATAGVDATIRGRIAVLASDGTTIHYVRVYND